MIQIPEEEAAARLEDMVAPAEEPGLTEPQMARLLDIARRADRDGLAPTDEGWTPTWDLNAAAAQGWMWKAGKVTPRFNATLDGTSLQRAQLFAHCIQMADTYAKKLGGSMRVTGVSGVDPDVIVN